MSSTSNETKATPAVPEIPATNTADAGAADTSTWNIPETLNTDNILDVLWNVDVNRCSVSDRDEKGQWKDPNADILLDKQNRAKGSADSLEDNAPRPLFHRVSPEALDKPTYRTFMELLDNYDAVVNNVEYLNDGELDEIFAFLEAILETDCMKLCFKYVTEVLGFSYTVESFKRQLFNMWFELHTLRVDEVLAPTEVEAEREAIRSEHKERPETAAATEPVFGRQQVIVRYCSGFEHVFMGEITIPQGEKIGSVLGLHNWIKFYMDERMTEENGNQGGAAVNFLGTKYTKPSLSKIGAPFVCVKFRWDQDGHVYIKERGSFFVGCSPEFSMAMATVCFFETWTPELAHKCGWENKIPTKFKCKREIGGYKYDYYICRQQKYLVSCFQELIGMTEETEARLKIMQAKRDEEAFAAKMAAKHHHVRSQAEELGITLPDGTSLSRKAYNRLKRRLAAQAEEEGISVDDLIASGRVALTLPEQNQPNDDAAKKEVKKEEKGAGETKKGEDGGKKHDGKVKEKEKEVKKDDAENVKGVADDAEKTDKVAVVLNSAPATAASSPTASASTSASTSASAIATEAEAALSVA